MLTVREAAMYLRVCTATVYRMIHDGRLRAIRIGGSLLRIDPGDLILFGEPEGAR